MFDVEDRCLKYWDRYLTAISDSVDDILLLEQANFNYIRKVWWEKGFPIKGLHKSKRYVDHCSILEKCINWCSGTRSSFSIVDYDIRDVLTLEEFADTF